MFPVGTIINGSYRILALLGSGGMGAVFKAYEEKQAREVALKFMYRDIAADQISSRRFLQEGEILASIGHPNVVKVFSLETDAETGLPFLIMEYFPGIGLTEFLREFQQDPFWLIKTFLDLCDGVRAIHVKNVIHRDLKPDNVLVNTRGNLKIIDFGIAKAARRQTQTGIALGTSLYMSPEQCEGRANITYKSDIYSMGVAMWEVLTGKTPFCAEDDSSDPFLAVVVKHLTAPVPAENLAGTRFGPLFADLLIPMLAKVPEKRPDIDFIIEYLLHLREKHFAHSDSAFMRFTPAGAPMESPFGSFCRFQDTASGQPALILTITAPMSRSEEEIQERVHRLMRVRHFSVAGILQKGFDKASNRHFLAMEPPGTIPLVTLRDALRQDRAFLLKFLVQVLEGMKAIHDVGEFHGYLHPSLVGFNDDEDVRISGFPMIPVPLSKPKPGKPAWNYLAPELLTEDGSGGPAADVFAAGVIFWELLFGNLPPPVPVQAKSGKGRTGIATDDTLTMNAVSAKDPLFPFLASLCRMIRPEPSKRPTVGELLSLLRSLYAESGTSRRDRTKIKDRCLVLTRNKTVCSLLNATLLEFGFRSLETKSLEELFRVSATGPAIAWFIDLDSIRSTVAEIMGRARRVAPDARIILLAGRFPSDLVNTCLQHQVTALLVKPLLVPRLVQVISALSEEPELIEGENLLAPWELTEPEPVHAGTSRHNVLFFECPLCQERFGCMQNKPGAIEIRGTESDFCPICTAGNVPELYAVVVCPACHYANFSGRFQKPPADAYAVGGFLTPARRECRTKMAFTLDFLGKRGFFEGRRSFELAAAGVQELEPADFHRFAGELFLKASWLCRRYGKALEEAEYQARALECVMTLYQPYLRIGTQFPGMNAVSKKLKPGQDVLKERAVLVNAFLGGELSARLGLNEQAEFYFDQAFELPFFPRFALLARHINKAFRDFKNRKAGKYPAQSPNFGTEASKPTSPARG
jgi:serine/threonine protein kinase/uncharacterized protein (DUF2225 family)